MSNSLPATRFVAAGEVTVQRTRVSRTLSAQSVRCRLAIATVVSVMGAAVFVSPAHGATQEAAISSARAASLPQLAARLSPHVAPHVTIAVDSSSDGVDDSTQCAVGHTAGTCTLRDAVDFVNADPSHFDAIVVPSGRHIVLTHGPITASVSTSIAGTGAQVDGNSSQILLIANNADVTITGLTFTAGAALTGGAIYCGAGVLQLVSVTVTHNQALNGGGLATASGCSTWIISSTFSRNLATNSGGGALLGGPTVIVGSTFGGLTVADGNNSPKGAGFANIGGTTEMVSSSVKHNTTPLVFGTGVGIYNSSQLDIRSSAISYNTSVQGGNGIGINNTGQLSVSSTFLNYNAASGTEDSSGSGIYSHGSTTTLSKVTFTGDSTHLYGFTAIGGVLYSNDQVFQWDGGTINGTVNGSTSANESIRGGVLRIEGHLGVVANLTINGTNNQSLPNAAIMGGVFYVTSSVRMSHIKVNALTNHGVFVDGGVVFTNNTASIDGLTVTNSTNLASTLLNPFVDGGVIYNQGNCVLRGIVITGLTNRAYYGGPPSVTAVSSSIDGGVIDNSGTVSATGLSVTKSTETASGGLGSIFGGIIVSAGTMSLSDSQVLSTTITGDSVLDGGLVSSSQSLTLSDVTFATNQLTLIGGSGAGVVHSDGALMFNSGVLRASNLTVANNTVSAPSDASYIYGIDSAATSTYVNATLAANTMSGPSGSLTSLLVSEDRVVYLFDSIIAGSPSWKSCHVVVTGAIVSGGNNLDNGTSCHLSRLSDQSSVSPKLLAVANNGGPVRTAAFSTPKSPAINRGSNLTCSPTDARGIARPQGSTCDLGAFEVVKRH